jgi:hypothetical protein
MLGVELYADKVQFQNDFSDEFQKPRFNFDKLSNSVVCVFICLIGDSWNSIMQDVMRS